MNRQRRSFSTEFKHKAACLVLDNFRYKDKWWVIDIAGNHLRVLVFIQFVHNRMYVKHILTHSEYDKLCNRYARGELK